MVDILNIHSCASFTLISSTKLALSTCDVAVVYDSSKVSDGELFFQTCKTFYPLRD